MNTNYLRAAIIKKGYTHAEVAKKIGMSESTFSKRIKKGNFCLDEADRLIKLLDIGNPAEVFFAQKVS